MLTGDSLFVGDAARPDLAVEAAEGAEGLFHSLRRLLELPDGVEVFPGHVAGSLCGKSMSSRSSTTIGFERRFNPMATIDVLDAFVAESASGSRSEAAEPRSHRGAQPRPVSGGRSGRAPSFPCRRRARSSSTSARSTAHLAGHRPGAINVPVAGTSFSTKAGFVLDADPA